LKTTEFPLFRQRDIICGTTSGRDSNITPSTPIGHRTWYSIRPSSSSSADIVSPTGSFSFATSLMPAIIPSIFSSLTRRRFTNEPESSPLLSASIAEDMSPALASSTSDLRASSASAMASSAASFTDASSAAMVMDASFALTTPVVIPFMFTPPCILSLPLFNIFRNFCLSQRPDVRGALGYCGPRRTARAPSGGSSATWARGRARWTS
jgi:hypothetical protein